MAEFYRALRELPDPQPDLRLSTSHLARVILLLLPTPTEEADGNGTARTPGGGVDPPRLGTYPDSSKFDSGTHDQP